MQIVMHPVRLVPVHFQLIVILAMLTVPITLAPKLANVNKILIQKINKNINYFLL